MQASPFDPCKVPDSARMCKHRNVDACIMLDGKQKSSGTRGMNKLPLETRVQILSMLVEGSSLRSITRVTGVSINTVTKLLVDAGTVCAAFHDANVARREGEADSVR